MVPPEARKPVLVAAVDLLAGDLDRPLVEPVQPGDGVEQRRLAAAGRAGDGDELAWRDVEIDSAQGTHRGELGGERPPGAAYPDCRLGRHRATSVTAGAGAASR